MNNKVGFTKENAQILKGIAVLLMIWYHIMGYNTRADGLILLLGHEQNVRRISQTLGLCITFFVFISAYGLTKQYRKADENSGGNRGDCRSYLPIIKKRLKNIILGAASVFIACMLLFWGHFDFVGTYQATSMKNLIFYGVMEALGLAQYTNIDWINGGWWYLALAMEMLFLIAILHWMYQRFGWTILMLAFFVSMKNLLPDEAWNIYLPTMALGVVCAETELLEIVETKLLMNKKWMGILWAIVLLVICICVVRFTYPYRNGTYTKASPVALAIIALAGTLMVDLCFSRIAGLKSILMVIGKHSMNIYLFHSYLAFLCYSDQIFSLQYAELVFLVILIVSWAFSVSIEYLKSCVGSLWEQRKV